MNVLWRMIIITIIRYLRLNGIISCVLCCNVIVTYTRVYRRNPKYPEDEGLMAYIEVPDSIFTDSGVP